MSHIRIGIMTAALWPLGAPAVADSPENIAKDFCHAVAAQARCHKYFTMPKDTEARLEELAGAKLRGEGAALNEPCDSAMNDYYAIEDETGLAAACQATLERYGPGGSRRPGLLEARAAPDMKMPEAEIAVLAKDLCYAIQVAEDCPDISLMEGAEERLVAKTGVDLRKQGGYFSSECGSGVFAASLAKGKTNLEDYCTKSLVAYGPSGNQRADLLDGPTPPMEPEVTTAQIQPAADGAAEPATAEKPIASKAKDNTPSTKESAPTAEATAPRMPDNALTILTEVPALPEGMTPADVLGALPGTLSESECGARSAEARAARERLDAGTNLAEQTRDAIRAAVEIKTLEALCPDLEPPAMPDEAVVRVVATGLEPCHIVLDEIKALQQAGNSYREQKLYRGLMAINEARQWTLESFAPSCSPLTSRMVESQLTYAKKQVDRDRKHYGCRIWQDALRAEMDAVRDLADKKNWGKAIAVLDTRAAALVQAVGETCKQAGYSRSARKNWVTHRQSIQQRMLR